MYGQQPLQRLYLFSIVGFLIGIGSNGFFGVRFRFYIVHNRTVSVFPSGVLGGASGVGHRIASACLTRPKLFQRLEQIFKSVQFDFIYR